MQRSHTMRATFPFFFVSRRVKNIHLHRKLLALTCRKKPCEEEGEYDGGRGLDLGEER